MALYHRYMEVALQILPFSTETLSAPRFGLDSVSLVEDVRVLISVLPLAMPCL